MTTPHPGHTGDCPVFMITAHPAGRVDIEVCWDQIDAAGVARALRQLADGLDKLPPGIQATGGASVVVPL